MGKREGYNETRSLLLGSTRADGAVLRPKSKTEHVYNHDMTNEIQACSFVCIAAVQQSRPFTTLLRHQQQRTNATLGTPHRSVTSHIQNVFVHFCTRVSDFHACESGCALRRF